MILDSPTAEETAKVRAYECRMNGHTFDYLMVWGNDGPVEVYCTNCGKRWAVSEVSK